MDTHSTQELDDLLKAMIHSAEGISDLLFVASRPPQMEIHGKIKPLGGDTPAPALTSERIEGLARAIIKGNPRLLEDLAKSGSCDCSYSLPELCRFRVNIYKQNGNFAMVLRRLQSKVPSLDALNLPPVFREVIKEKNGLIFVTGGTGSGKTTKLAALLNEVNQTEEVHVVTLEDPIEFLHPHKSATFSQRELGRDFFNFPDGLRAALRQAPKIIFVGEIRHAPAAGLHQQDQAGGEFLRGAEAEDGQDAARGPGHAQATHDAADPAAATPAARRVTDAGGSRLAVSPGCNGRWRRRFDPFLTKIIKNRGFRAFLPNSETSVLNVEASTFNIEATTRQVEATKPRIETTGLNIEATTINIETTKLNVEATKQEGVTTKLRPVATKQRVEATTSRAELTGGRAKVAGSCPEIAGRRGKGPARSGGRTPAGRPGPAGCDLSGDGNLVSSGA